MIRHRDSHVDHGLTEAQLHHLLDRFADRRAFFIETFTLPAEFGTVPCGLYGPLMGDPAIREEEVTYASRGERTWNSRLIALPARQQHEVTVIAGPHEETCLRCGGDGIWYGLSIPPDNGPHQCDDCNRTGKIKHPCVLYTAFGGPIAPQELGDPNCKDPAASAAFWREHALAK